MTRISHLARAILLTASVASLVVVAAAAPLQGQERAQQGRVQGRVQGFLLAYEGLSTELYEDHLGQPHIGVGRFLGDGGGITEDEALYLLGNDLESVRSELDDHLPWWRSLDQVRRQSLILMAFQMGVGGLLSFDAMLSSLKTEDYAEAAYHALDSRWAEQTPKRAKNVAAMIETGEWQCERY